MISKNNIQYREQNENDINGQPLISIVTVVFNGAKTLEQTIQSVISQPYQNKEYIIIDGGSNDGTLELIRKYEASLAYWISEPDHGIFDAMNKGIAKARGEIIGIINADDWYEAGIFNTIANQYLKVGPEFVIHGLLRNFLDEKIYSVAGNTIRGVRYNPVHHPTCFIPARIYQNFGNYNINYRYSADYDLILRYIDRGVKFIFIEKIIANFRLGGLSSISKAEKEMYKVKAKHHLISKTEEVLRVLNVTVRSLIKRLLK